MRIQIFQINVSPERREVNQDAVQSLANSISESGLLNPITVDQDYTLIAGLHRLEAAKLLGWKEIECTVSGLEGLQAELAEIDENFVRKNLSDNEVRELLLRRKEIYERLHPETKATYDGGAFRGNQHQKVVADKMSATTKSFVQDTADRWGVDPRTVRREIQTAKNLTPEAKKIIRDTKVTKADALKLSRLPPEQQEEAASRLVAKEIHSIDEYYSVPPEPEEVAPQEVVPQEKEPQEAPAPPAVPYTLGSKHYASLEESIADLKDPNKDCSYTPDTLLADIDGFVANFHKNFAWYSDPFCAVVFPKLSQVQFEFVRQRFATISSVMEALINYISKEINQ